MAVAAVGGQTWVKPHGFPVRGHGVGAEAWVARRTRALVLGWDADAAASGRDVSSGGPSVRPSIFLSGVATC